MVGPKIKAWAKLAILIAMVAGAFFVVEYTEFGQSLARELREYIAGVNPIAKRALYVIVYILSTVLFLPGVVFSALGALLFGVWEGTLYTWLGASIGATLAFPLARFLSRDFVNQLLHGRLLTLDRWLGEHGFVGLFIVRLVPLFPFNGVNFGCGLTSIGFRDYVLATAVGIVPGTFVYQYLFATIGEKVLTEGFGLRDLATPDVLLPLGLFVVFIVAGGWLARRLRRTQITTGEEDAKSR